MSLPALEASLAFQSTGNTSSLSVLVFRAHRSNTPSTIPCHCSSWSICHSCFARHIQNDPSNPNSSAPAPGLLSCAGENHTFVSTGTMTNLSARLSLLLNLFFFFHLFLVSSLLYFPLFSSSPNLSQLSPSFSADDLPTNCPWDFLFSSFF